MSENITEIYVTYNIIQDTTLFSLLLLFIAIIFLIVAMKFPLFFLLAWFISWYGGFLMLGSSTEGMMILTYFLFGIFALFSFALEMLYSEGGKKK